MNQLTIIILTYNEERNIRECLNSMKGIRANIFVVDSYSEDNTLSILNEYGIKYIQHPFKDYSNQRNWAQENNPFNTEWVFHIDAGERISNEAVEWLNSDFDPNSNIDGYMFSRRIIFLGKWIKRGGLYPNYHLRLFKKHKGKCEEKAYDQHFVMVNGKTQTLKKGIDIIDTVADNLKDFTISHTKWAYFEAIETISGKKTQGEIKAKFWGSPMERRRWLKNNLFESSIIFLRSFAYFIYRFFFSMGFLDGKVGIIFHFLQGFWFRFFVDSIILEIKIKLEREKCSLEELIVRDYDTSLLKLLKSDKK